MHPLQRWGPTSGGSQLPDPAAVCSAVRGTCTARTIIEFAEQIRRQVPGLATGAVGMITEPGQADAIILPGSSGTYNSSPSRVALSTTYGFRRTITISAVNGVSNLRQITVLVTYATGKYQGQYTLNTTISNFS